MNKALPAPRAEIPGRPSGRLADLPAVRLSRVVPGSVTARPSRSRFRPLGLLFPFSPGPTHRAHLRAGRPLALGRGRAGASGRLRRRSIAHETGWGSPPRHREDPGKGPEALGAARWRRGDARAHPPGCRRLADRLTVRPGQGRRSARAFCSCRISPWARHPRSSIAAALARRSTVLRRAARAHGLASAERSRRVVDRHFARFESPSRTSTRGSIASICDPPPVHSCVFARMAAACSRPAGKQFDGDDVRDEMMTVLVAMMAGFSCGLKHALYWILRIAWNPGSLE